MYSVQVSETFPYSLVSTLISFNKSISWHIYRVSGFGNWDYDPFHRIDKMEMFSYSENAGAFSVWIFLTSIEISLFKIEILNKFDNKYIDKYVDISAWRLTFCSKIYSDHRKYKDYVYRKMLVQEYLKKWRIFNRVKPKNDMMFHDIYNCICQNTKK